MRFTYKNLKEEIEGINALIKERGANHSYSINTNAGNTVLYLKRNHDPPEITSQHLETGTPKECLVKVYEDELYRSHYPLPFWEHAEKHLSQHREAS